MRTISKFEYENAHKLDIDQGLNTFKKAIIIYEDIKYKVKNYEDVIEVFSGELLGGSFEDREGYVLSLFKVIHLIKYDVEISDEFYKIKESEDNRFEAIIEIIEKIGIGIIFKIYFK